jgi:CheY-like chemotaxis protein
MRVIQEQAYRATTLISQILDFSRRAQLEQQPMQLLSLLKEILKLWERTLPDDISVSLNHDGSTTWIDADPTRIQQVLMNLATNARDAMPDGGRIEITLQEIILVDDAQLPLPTLATGAWVRLDFRDQGIGMSEEVQAHLFEPFFTTKPPGEGTGLGLAQIHGIVKQHGGEVDVVSALGEGTTVSIYLPALPPPESAGGMFADANAVPQGTGERVLVVEDNVVTRGAIVETLETLGYQVLQASNGQEALARYEAACAAGGEPIDMIVSDLSMPEMGGKALVAALREEDQHTPILILSGHIHDDEIAALEALERVRCLRKPVDFAKLAQVVAASLD